MTKTIEATALTALELALMNEYAFCEMNQGNGARPNSAADVWTYLWADIRAANLKISAKAVGGLLTSLSSKGFIAVEAPCKDDPDGGVSFTEAGYAAWAAATAPKVTKVPAALAYGLDVHSARNCADRIKDVRQSERAKAKADAPTAANPLAAASEFFSKAVKAAPTKIAGPRLILKTNKEVRAQLTEAAKALGGNRLIAKGYESYTAFLNGIERNQYGSTIVHLQAVKGSTVLPGTIELMEHLSVITVTVQA